MVRVVFCRVVRREVIPLGLLIYGSDDGGFGRTGTTGQLMRGEKEPVRKGELMIPRSRSAAQPDQHRATDRLTPGTRTRRPILLLLPAPAKASKHAREHATR